MTTIVVDGDGEAPVIAADEVAAEVVAEAEPEVVETITDAAVQIAEINANRDIVLAEIAAETDQAYLEDAEHSELEQCRTELRHLSERFTDLEKEMSLILTTLTPHNSDPPPSPAVELVSVEPTPVSPEEEAPAIPAEPVRKAKALRWI